jgi:uncharacterized hydrophobic protein (TIGR00271 family)
MTRRRVALTRGIIGIAAGTLSLLRPDGATMILGLALVAASLLELAIVTAADEDRPGSTLRGSRRLRVVAGVGAGVALAASSLQSVHLETQIAAVALTVVGLIDAWEAWRASTPELRTTRSIRAALAIAIALVLFAVPSVALGIVVLSVAIGWIAYGAITLVGIYQTGRLPDGADRSAVGVVDIVSGWLSRRDIGQEHRSRILEAYDYDPADRDRLGRFFILLVLASIIASAGLIQNSVASIIGAMIIAPLMGPIVGIALGIVTGIPARTIRCTIVAGMGIGLTILIGVAMGAWVGNPTDASNSEILGRTSPTTLDLVVALAAGAAGAYAASNAKVADSLPGVAIAIALVPPLGTAGILISLGEWSLASGAMLLFITNFVSIVLAASVVFVLVGVVPIARLVENSERTRGWFATFAVAGILLLVPLAIGGRQAIQADNQMQLATQAVNDWLAPSPGFELVTINVTNDQVDVTVSGPGAPPTPESLQSDLDAAFGADVTLDLQVIPTTVYSSEPTPTPNASAAP